jgi:hypothetical protein
MTGCSEHGNKTYGSIKKQGISWRFEVFLAVKMLIVVLWVVTCAFL